MSLAVCLMGLFLVPLAFAGLALIQQGLGRSRSSAHAMLATLCAVSVAAIVFVLIGSAWAAWPGAPSHVLMLGSAHLNWLGKTSFFAQDAIAGGLYPTLVLAFDLFAVALLVIIPVSSGNDRWRLLGVCISIVFLAGFTFPLFVHAVWGGGWLTQLTASFGLPGFMDAGGAGTIQALGGLAAVSVAWVLGPRQGKYNEGIASAIPGHNIVLVLFGCLLALVGWTGLEAAGSLLFSAATPQQLVMVAVNALLSASAACLAAVVTTRLRYRKTDASLSANGFVAGLVAGSAACGMVSPLAAVLTGVVAGGLVTFLVEALELKLFIDDPDGAIAVHGGAGLWGLFAAGLFAPTTGPRAALVLSQLIGIATLLGLMLPLVHCANLLLNRIVPYRVDADGDWQGMDIRELGAGAYPEFVMHADDFVPR